MKQFHYGLITLQEVFPVLIDHRKKQSRECCTSSEPSYTPLPTVLLQTQFGADTA